MEIFKETKTYDNVVDEEDFLCFFQVCQCTLYGYFIKIFGYNNKSVFGYL